MVKKYITKQVPVELDEMIRRLQAELRQELGMNITFMNASRVAAKRLDKSEGKVINIIMPKRKKGYDKLTFQP